MKNTKIAKKIWAAALSMALCLAPAAGGTAAFAEEGGMEERTIEQIISEMTVREKIGQMMMVDFRTWNEDPGNEDSPAEPVTELREEISDAIARDRFGGVILFLENCAENEQTRKLTEGMQEANRNTDSSCVIPLMIAIDQEGGRVFRLAQGTRWPGNMALAATGDPLNAKETASRIGGELSALGIHVDFAPVLDVNNNPENPVIGVRSFSDDPEIVKEYGLQYMSGLQENGIITSLKHFPGHGDVATDSHTGFPVLEKTYDELKECELIPFQAAIDAGADMVMTAHIQYPQIEKETAVSTSTGEEVYLPATLSRTILTDILRGDMGFDGVIVSDALNMSAIKDNFDRKDAFVRAIDAGIDLFLMPVPVTDADTLKELEDMMDYLCEKVEDGTIAESRLDESVDRLLTLKDAYGILEYTDQETEKTEAAEPGNDDNHALEWELMQKAAVLLKNDNDTLPLKAEAGEKVLFLYTAESRLMSSEFARLRLVDEGLIPEDVSFDTLLISPDNREECVSAAKEADHVIIVSTAFSLGDLNPETDGGAASGVIDDVISALHDADRPAVLISSYLPYDAARYSDADAIVVSLGSSEMKELPQNGISYSVNIPAAICGIFGEFEFTGKLPVNIPAMNDTYGFTDKILYKRQIQ